MLPRSSSRSSSASACRRSGKEARLWDADGCICGCYAADGQIFMYYAPIGLGAYFTTLVGDYGNLLGAYLRSMIVYHIATFGYFFVAFTIALIATEGKEWAPSGKHHNSLDNRLYRAATPPAVNLVAAHSIGIPGDIAESCFPSERPPTWKALPRHPQDAFLGIFNIPSREWER